MTIVQDQSTTTTVRSRDVHLHVHVQGSDGPGVLLVAGLGDPVEAWQAQLDGLSDRYRLTAYDNRGVGRTPLPHGPLTVEQMADDAAAALRSSGATAAHVAGFSGGSVIAQELALRHPGVVRSLVLVSTWPEPDAWWRAVAKTVRLLAESAPSERDFLETFYTWIYTRRSHLDGTVAAIVEGALVFPHEPDPDVVPRTLDAFSVHSTTSRLPQIDAPTLIIAGGRDVMTPPDAEVAASIPGAVFEVWDDESAPAVPRGRGTVQRSR